MTIIESALERAKALGTAQRAKAPRADSHVQHRQAARNETQRSELARTNDTIPAPSVQFQPHRVTVDPTVARENRLLLSSSVMADHAPIAAYGMLRTRLLHRVRAENWTTIGITSAAPQDGKSLTALNLSLSLAREKNSSVVLIDLDLRNPTVCHDLGVEPPVELREFFEGKASAPQDLFMSLGIDNLMFAGSVSTTPAAAELLASSKLEELLDFVKRSTTHPLIIVDLPPLPSPDDALVVAPRLDAMLLVVSQGVTPVTEMNKALELLSGFPVAGVVLNRATEGSRKYAYGYGGAYGPR